MKIIAAYFDRKRKYVKLLDVFLKSAADKMPNVEVDLIRRKAPRRISRKHDMAHAFNLAAEKAIESNQNIAGCDIDLLFIHSVEPVFKKDFDIAVTVREKYKYNTGLWFMKPTDKARDFVNQWIDNTNYLMLNSEEEREIIAEYAGIDQASLAMTINQNKTAKTLELQCTEWNSCQGEWKDFNRNTKVLHIKSALRGIAMKKRIVKPGEEYIEELAKKWRAYL